MGTEHFDWQRARERVRAWKQKGLVVLECINAPFLPTQISFLSLEEPGLT
jgi:hypothetical protein